MLTKSPLSQKNQLSPRVWDKFKSPNKKVISCDCQESTAFVAIHFPGKEALHGWCW